MVLYAATTNAGKIRDFAAADRADGAANEIQVLPLPGISGISEPVEAAPNFAGNARLKAVYYSRCAPGLLVLADDSGLEVAALDGAPGVRSARYAEGFATRRRRIRMDEPFSRDARNNLCLLEAMRNVPVTERGGRYRCVLALARDGDVLLTAEGTVEGEILTVPRGEGGFGYDPLFYLPKLGKTMAEIDAAEKWNHSHRGRAFRALLEQLGPLSR